MGQGLVIEMVAYVSFVRLVATRAALLPARQSTYVIAVESREHSLKAVCQSESALFGSILLRIVKVLENQSCQDNCSRPLLASAAGGPPVFSQTLRLQPCSEALVSLLSVRLEQEIRPGGS